MAKMAAPEAPHLLVVDDDERLRGLLRRYLTDNGFRITLAADAAEARLKLKSLQYDLAIVDVMMPGENGFELTASLKAERRVPVLLLTAMAEAENRIHGLEQGAEDYLVKPFEPRELVLRIRNILARAALDGTAAAGEARFGGFRFDLKRAELWRGDEAVHLTTAEAALLSALAGRPGTPVSREQLAEEAQFSGNVRTVDVQITRLRRKIERDPRFPRYLQTVRGIGYVLKPD
ncbi:MAG TPA: response regulator transcription factor [Stellaceae bacterium]|jgi:two-component system phosphate regulon response regulator OmpR|nr:response regulator transcription factor [Stellaceae bacterium]